MSRVARRVIVGRFDDASSARDSRTAAAGADARMKRRTSRPVAQTEFEAKNARVSGKKSPVAAQQDKANGWGFEVGHRLNYACRTQSSGELDRAAPFATSG